TGTHELGQVVLQRVVGKTGQFGVLVAAVVAARQGDAQYGRRGDRIAAEGLVEIAHAEQQQGIGVLRLDAVVLVHERCGTACLLRHDRCATGWVLSPARPARQGTAMPYGRPPPRHTASSQLPNTMPASDRKLTWDELGRVSPAEHYARPKRPVRFVLDDVRSRHNVGSIFRTADAFGLEGITLCGFTPLPPHREIEKTA